MEEFHIQEYLHIHILFLNSNVIMKKNILISFSFIILYGCGSTCEDVKKYSKLQQCYIKVTEKSKKKFIKFNGYDKKNKFIEFEVSEFWDIYDSVEAGDSLVKEIGKTEIKLIKKDTTLIFPLMCGGRVVE